VRIAEAPWYHGYHAKIGGGARIRTAASRQEPQDHQVITNEQFTYSRNNPGTEQDGLLGKIGTFLELSGIFFLPKSAGGLSRRSDT